MGMPHPELEQVIPGARGRIVRALVRLDGPRTISDVARIADVSRDRAATVVDELEGIGVVERTRAGRAHLVALIDENPITQSLRDIDRARQRSESALRAAAEELHPRPTYMAIYGSWARGDATPDSDLDVAVISPPGDHDELLAELERWSGYAQRVTGHRTSLVIAESRGRARGPLWSSIRRDAIVLLSEENPNRAA